jgi:hypothetical protein
VWVGFKLPGVKSNRDAIGAITIFAGKRPLVRYKSAARATKLGCWSDSVLLPHLTKSRSRSAGLAETHNRSRVLKTES